MKKFPSKTQTANKQISISPFICQIPRISIKCFYDFAQRTLRSFVVLAEHSNVKFKYGNSLPREAAIEQLNLEAVVDAIMTFRQLFVFAVLKI
jgi:hypothetical protein